MFRAIMNSMNRKTVLGLAMLAALGLVVGCAGTDERTGPRPIQDLVKEGEAPQWITQKGAAFSGDRAVFYGVGNATDLITPSLKRKAAEAAARRDLAQEFQVYVGALQKQYLAETTAGALDRHSVEQHIEDVMKQITDQTLVGSSIVEYWENPERNEAYALARLDLARIQETLAGLQSTNAQFKELDAKLKESIKQNADKLHRELATELGQRSRAQ